MSYLNRGIVKLAVIMMIGFSLLFSLPVVLKAHCDRVNGPVAKAARKALETEKLKPASIWVGEKQEAELKAKFENSLKAYREGGPGREVAEKYFMSEAVRLHRAAEGMAFTGLKPASELSLDLEIAEKARETGDVQPVIDLLSEELAREVEKWFNKTRQAKQKMETEESLEAGREWADAYVKYIIYVHKLYQKIKAGPPHGVGETH